MADVAKAVELIKQALELLQDQPAPDPQPFKKPVLASGPVQRYRGENGAWYSVAQYSQGQPAIVCNVNGVNDETAVRAWCVNIVGVVPFRVDFLGYERGWAGTPPVPAWLCILPDSTVGA